MRREAMLVLVCLILAAVANATLASAQGQRSQQRGFPPGLPEVLLIQQRADALGLSEDTRAKLQALMDEVKPTGEKLQQESAGKLAKLQGLLNQPLPDEKALIAAGTATAEVAGRMRDQRLKTTVRARALLTEEQRTKFLAIRARVATSRAGGRR